jgi:hypothetical protein
MKLAATTLLFAIGIALPAAAELDGAQSRAELRYPDSQARVISVLPKSAEPAGIRVYRGGEVSYVEPGRGYASRSVVYESASQARIVRVGPKARARFGTVVVHAPEAFRPRE